MKRVVITGKNGYIANALRQRFEREGVFVTMLGLRDESWRQEDLSGADALIHTAALVHKGKGEYSLCEYRQVNTELTAQLAEKAKAAGIAQFIFFSTMAVYGGGNALSCFKKTEINENTPTAPVSEYGVSKLEAEQRLLPLEDASFKVAIVRPPFVYGGGCPGNYAQLRKLTLKTGLIPKLNNRKSMIYIDNLAEFVWQLYNRGSRGTFMPQNAELKSTWELAALIAEYNRKKVICSRLLALPVLVGSLFIKKLRTAFGSEFYSPRPDNADYCVVDFAGSVRLSELPPPPQSGRV